MASFLESPGFKKMTGMAYGFGASVVIIGALFKIQHYPGASVMLMIGMFIEAILFALSAVEKPHKNYEWELVFPQLDGGEGEPVKAGLAGGASKAGNTIDDIAKSGSLTASDAQRLNDGIRRLSESANQIADVTAAVSASTNYARSMNDA